MESGIAGCWQPARADLAQLLAGDGHLAIGGDCRPHMRGAQVGVCRELFCRAECESAAPESRFLHSSATATVLTRVCAELQTLVAELVRVGSASEVRVIQPARGAWMLDRPSAPPVQGSPLKACGKSQCSIFRRSYALLAAASADLCDKGLGIVY